MKLKINSFPPIILMTAVLGCILAYNLTEKKNVRSEDNDKVEISTDKVNLNLNDFKVERPKRNKNISDEKIFSKYEIKNLGKKFTKLANLLDSRHAEEKFQNSTDDNNENYQKSLRSLYLDYPETRDGERKIFIRERIISANFFKYTKHLKAKDCNILFSKISEAHQGAFLESTRINLSFDAAAVAERCSKSFYQTFKEFIETSTIEPAILAQANHYLKQYQRVGEGEF